MLRITANHELSGWRPQPMDMPLEALPGCPCCTGAIEPVAGIYCGQIVVVSQCPNCGWLGYGIRPRAEWFESFYASDWDEAGQAAQVDLSKFSAHPIAEFIAQIAKPPATVCDVGCGFGVAVYQLKQLGYETLGVEKSLHRASACWKQSRTWCEDSLSKFFRKFDIITTHHVLEHTVDPNAFIAEIAEHQDEGGILYISVPNQVGEPSMGCLLFLPHLHSFTVTSLCALAARHGYGLHAQQTCGFNLALAFRKDGGISQPQEQNSNAVEKLSRAVHANGQGRLLSWCGNLSDAWFTDAERFAEWRKEKWKPRAVYAERVGGPGRFPVELEVPCLFVK